MRGKGVLAGVIGGRGGGSRRCGLADAGRAGGLPAGASLVGHGVRISSFDTESRRAGEPFRDRLLRLPAFLRDGEGGQNGWSDQDLQDGFRLTGLFLLRHVLEPRGQGHSDARDGFINSVSKYRARISSAV